jgi:hypothetical protein
MEEQACLLTWTFPLCSLLRIYNGRGLSSTPVSRRYRNGRKDDRTHTHRQGVFQVAPHGARRAVFLALAMGVVSKAGDSFLAVHFSNSTSWAIGFRVYILIPNSDSIQAGRCCFLRAYKSGIARTETVHHVKETSVDGQTDYLSQRLPRQDW